jgi:hypothetical protein
MHQLKDHPSVQRKKSPITGDQVPPVHPAGATELTFTHDALIVKVASLGASADVSGPYTAGSEQWYATALLHLTDVPSFSMRYDGIAPVHNSDLESFFKGLTWRFTAAGNDSGFDWSPGPYQALVGDQLFFFTARDPDDENKLIGLMLVVDGSSLLTHIVWFKKADPEKGYSGPIWRLENAPKDGLTFSKAPLPTVKSAGVELDWFHLAEGGSNPAPGTPRARRSPTPAR